MKSSIYNIAHRGARSLAPENTMQAFLKAFEVGAHGVETDVSVTADGELILFHDTDLSRTTNVANVFPSRKKDSTSTFSLDEIQALDAGTWFIATDPFSTIQSGEVTQVDLPTPGNTRIPLLKELLCFCKDNSWFVNIELKSLMHVKKDFPLVAKTLKLIEELQLDTELFSISSFHHPFLKEIQASNPDIEINALIGGSKNLKQDWGGFNFPIYNANVRKTDVSQLLQAYQNNCRVNLYTVNREKDMIYYLRHGVEKIITDFPQLLADIKAPEL